MLLEHKLQSELNLTRLAVGCCNPSDAAIWRNSRGRYQWICLTQVRIEDCSVGILKRWMVQNIKRFRTELNSELFGDPWYHPFLAQRAIQVPQIGTNDRVSSSITVCTERRWYKAIRIEPNTVELLIAFVEVASRDSIRARRIGAQAVVNAVRDCSYCERSAG